MNRLLPAVILFGLAGCTTPIGPIGIPGVVEAEPEIAVLPVDVAPFVPAGTAPSVVFQDANGCYLYSIEVTNPPSGFPVRDDAGRQVCAGVPATDLPGVTTTNAPPVAAPAAPLAAPGAVTVAPVAPAPITTTPVGDLNLSVSGDIAAMGGQ